MIDFYWSFLNHKDIVVFMAMSLVPGMVPGTSKVLVKKRNLKMFIKYLFSARHSATCFTSNSYNSSEEEVP